MLEVALKRDFLSSDFETASELLGLPEEALISDLTSLPWIPKTTGGVALRLFEFDSSISYTPDQNNDPQKDKESEDFVGSETNVLSNVQEDDIVEATPVQFAYTQEENWTEPGLLVDASSSGRGGRPPRGRGRPRSRGKKPAVSGRPPRAAAANSNGEAFLRPRAQPRGGRKNGRRTSGRRPTKGTLGISNELVGGGGRRGKVTAKATLEDNDEWIETPELHEDDGEASSSGRSFQYKDYDDDFDGGGESSKLVGRGEFSLHSDDEYEDVDMNMKMDVNVDDEDYINEEQQQPEIRIGTARKMFPFEDPDLTSSSSSDYQ